MTGRGRVTARRAAAAVAGTVLLAGLTLPLTARPASACNVSYDYKPSLSLGGPGFGHGHPCSTGTSLIGVVIVGLLAIGGLAAAGALAVRRAQRILGVSTPGRAAGPRPDDTAQAGPPSSDRSGPARPGASPAGPLPGVPAHADPTRTDLAHAGTGSPGPGAVLTRYLHAAGLAPAPPPGPAPGPAGGPGARPAP